MTETKILAQLTTTQRLVVAVVSINGEDRIELRKEWRRTKAGEWTPSKGITIPYSYVQPLVDILTDLLKQSSMR